MISETKLIDVENKTVELFDDKELLPLGDYIPDLHWNQILVPKGNMNKDEIINLFKEHGVEVSICDDLSYWNCTFENCSLITIGYGNGLLGDGSIAPSIKLTFCENPNRSWKGY